MPQKLKIIFLGITLLATPLVVSADYLGQQVNFFIDPSYDAQNREQIIATLKKVSAKGYFYLENQWFENLTDGQKEKINQNLENLASEFDNVIYPKLTVLYAEEWRPGIDYDYSITILFHRLKEKTAGYFREEDEYEKLQSPKSNQREMVYLNAEFLFSPNIKSFLTHEFSHLITFNQKDRLRGVSEEVWLNEARAEMAITLLGYDTEYHNSNLQQRVKYFINSPSDSLTEWQNQTQDYGLVNVFIQYLVDHYGIAILTDSLKSSKIGIESLNEALKKNGFQKDFSQIFTDWLITVFLNDCQFGQNYCYKNESLKNLKVTPSLIFLPSTQKTDVSLNYSIKQWSGNWYRIIGGEGDLKLEFDGQDNVLFKVISIACKDSFDCKIDFLNLDKEQKAKISISDFAKNYTSLTLVPFIQSKISGFGSNEPSFPFFLSVSLTQKTSEEKLKEQLLTQIAFLKSEIAKLQAQIGKIGKIGTCTFFKNNLFYGMRDNPEVRCLQEFLKNQGSEIYPEGLVTGNFLSLTQNAVIRFQEKYAAEILSPLGLSRGTGYVGPSTRAKINKFLSL